MSNHPLRVHVIRYRGKDLTLAESVAEALCDMQILQPRQEYTLMSGQVEIHEYEPVPNLG